MPTLHPVRLFLRAETAACHERVDRAFSRFDLTDRGAYAAFLTAHARVLLPLEAVLDAAALWPAWTGRGDLLRGDLATLGHVVPAGETVIAGGAAARWGMLYVLEGSRLGGAMLARQVGPGLPAAYLAAAHRGGSWARFGDAIEQAGVAAEVRGDAGWRADLLSGAERAFALFEGAVRD
ncbi:biliverdin-producing heme oxygenase [Sphingomonas montana]|uniref:biliverdin-producing heme oxygenase n=1 Tax=Sphingomonas montana TaxID=1843236 RepID=UPI00096CA25B|nr:biliverdin-producing heme oxygenase [Sphingomonas montana]